MLQELDLQKEELKILKQFKAYCEKHGLRYYLEGGTLIGAVRHQGFIPWDDDIDTIMPRRDYEKLIELEKTEKIGDNLYILTDKIGTTFRSPYIKICNEKTRLFEDGVEQVGGLFIDVFPMDGAANEISRIEREYRFMDAIKVLENYAWMNKEERKNLPLTKKLRAKLCRMLGTRFFGLWLHNLFTRYECGQTKYVAQVVWSSHLVYSETQAYLNAVQLKFEDDFFPVPSCYHERLTMMYGDYMCLPPENKRKSKHSIVAEWKE